LVVAYFDITEWELWKCARVDNSTTRLHTLFPYTVIPISFSSYSNNVDEATASKFDSHNWKIWLIIPGEVDKLYNHKMQSRCKLVAGKYGKFDIKYRYINIREISLKIKIVKDKIYSI